MISYRCKLILLKAIGLRVKSLYFQPCAHVSLLRRTAHPKGAKIPPTPHPLLECSPLCKSLYTTATP